MDKKYYENDNIWKPGAFSNLEHERIKVTASMIPGDVKTLLDVGCGNGLFLNYVLNNNNLKLLGIDASSAALKYVKTDKLKGNISDLPLESNCFDIVSSLEVIEHLNVDEYTLGLKELARVSKKYILISVPLNQSLEDGFRQCPLCKTKFNLVHHKRTFDIGVIENLFKDDGFEIIKLGFFGKDEEMLLVSSLCRFYRKIKTLPIKVAVPCPVCGFSIKRHLSSKVKPEYKKYRSLTSMLRPFWPKRYKDRWVIALYKRLRPTVINK